MKTVVLLVVIACGGTRPPSMPSNRAAPGTAPEQKRTGGVIDLRPGDRDWAMEHALDEMAAHCGPDNFKIVQEGEEVRDATNPTLGPKTVWRVHYLCN
jgi:hypothetical protein